MLSEVADGVWVRQSEWVWSNAIVVRGEGGLILVDPGIDGSDLNQLADDVDGLDRCDHSALRFFWFAGQVLRGRRFGRERTSCHSVPESRMRSSHSTCQHSHRKPAAKWPPFIHSALRSLRSRHHASL